MAVGPDEAVDMTDAEILKKLAILKAEQKELAEKANEAQAEARRKFEVTLAITAQKTKAEAEELIAYNAAAAAAAKVAEARAKAEEALAKAEEVAKASEAKEAAEAKAKEAKIRANDAEALAKEAEKLASDAEAKAHYWVPCNPIAFSHLKVAEDKANAEKVAKTEEAALAKETKEDAITKANDAKEAEAIAKAKMSEAIVKAKDAEALAKDAEKLAKDAAKSARLVAAQESAKAYLNREPFIKAIKEHDLKWAGKKEAEDKAKQEADAKSSALAKLNNEFISELKNKVITAEEWCEGWCEELKTTIRDEIEAINIAGHAITPNAEHFNSDMSIIDEMEENFKKLRALMNEFKQMEDVRNILVKTHNMFENHVADIVKQAP
jgi:hypothetical protein